MLLFTAFNSTFGGSFADNTRQLARELGLIGKHEAAATEYRRLAIMEEEPEKRAVYYWMTAYEYLKSEKYESVQKMLDSAEDSSTNITAEAILLRAEAAVAVKKFTEADFYLKNIIEHHGTGATGTHNTAIRNLAQVFLLQGKSDDAKNVLLNSPTPCPAAVKAVEAYKTGSDRSPRVGGLLGLVPGLGYAYSGEYANALRSLILNGLFIYAMADTADNDQWGAFTAVTFFEITWFTGSVYGGIDAAERFNRDRLNTCLESVKERSGFRPDLGRLPILSLQFEF